MLPTQRFEMSCATRNERIDIQSRDTVRYDDRALRDTTGRHRLDLQGGATRREEDCASGRNAQDGEILRREPGETFGHAIMPGTVQPAVMAKTAATADECEREGCLRWHWP